MMNKKYLFFDVDGTITDPNTRQPVQSAIAALHKLQANGHFVGIATGRPYPFAKQFAELIGIHNYVCSGGNTLILDDEIIGNRPLPKHEVLAIIRACQEANVPFAMTTEDDVQMISEFASFRELIDEAHTLHKIKIVPPFNYEAIPEYRRVFISLMEEQQVKLPKMSMAASNYHKTFLTIEPDDKFQGIQNMIKHVHGVMEDVVVFGDGINDIQMFDQAPLSIAVGNAIDAIKERADYITDNSVDDGVWNACKHFGWLS